jgi:hypothetical protein
MKIKNYILAVGVLYKTSSFHFHLSNQVCSLLYRYREYWARKTKKAQNYSSKLNVNFIAWSLLMRNQTQSRSACLRNFVRFQVVFVCVCESFGLVCYTFYQVCKRISQTEMLTCIIFRRRWTVWACRLFARLVILLFIYIYEKVWVSVGVCATE